MSETPDYYDRVNPDLLAAIPAGLERILEFGCGAGALGQAVKSKQPTVEYCGVELSGDAAKRAKARLNRVVEADADTFDPLTVFDEGSFDLLVYGDVLEHLRDPWAVLKSHRRLLKSGGRILACVPNVQHWTMLVTLLQGTWQYKSEGLLDKTHLRFFDIGTMVVLFQEAGFKLEKAIARNFPINPVAFEKIQELLLPLLKECAVNPADFRARSLALQYVVSAQKIE